MLSKEEAYDLVDHILSEAEGYTARVLVMSEAEGLTRYANSGIHQNVFEDTTRITITISGEDRRSRVSTTTCDREGLRAAVADAIENLEYLPHGEKQPPPVRGVAPISLDRYDEDLERAFDVHQRADHLKRAFGSLADGYRAYGQLSHAENRISFGNSAGVRHFARSNGVKLSSLIASDAGGSGYAAETSERAGEADIPAAFSRAYEKARLNRDQEEIEPGRHTVILEPLAVGNILAFMSFIGFSAKAVQNQLSFLTGREDEQVFDERITIVDDHTDENTASLPFDFEGYPRQKLTLVDSGISRDFAYDAATAEADGVPSTGHSVDMPQRGAIPLHLVMEAGDTSTEEMIADTEDGLLVTRFHYMNVVNPREAQLTGLTRDGVFRIRDGEIDGAVKNMRFTDSVLRALNSVAAISSERQRTPGFFGNFYVPAMKIEDFHFTGKTDA